jgi:hypothetical protein
VNSPVRTVAWSEGNGVYATGSDAFTAKDNSLISIFTFPDEDVFAEGNAFVDKSLF